MEETADRVAELDCETLLGEGIPSVGWGRDSERMLMVRATSTVGVVTGWARRAQGETAQGSREVRAGVAWPGTMASRTRRRTVCSLLSFSIRFRSTDMSSSNGSASPPSLEESPPASLLPALLGSRIERGVARRVAWGWVLLSKGPVTSRPGITKATEKGKMIAAIIGLMWRQSQRSSCWS